MPSYIQGADLPDLTFDWRDRNAVLIDFSTGYTFVLKLGKPGQAATLTKSTGITGAATSPNVTAAWSTSGELNTIAPGVYTLDLIATRTSDSKQRLLRDSLTVQAAQS
jgi:hypothetical protein